MEMTQEEIEGNTIIGDFMELKTDVIRDNYTCKSYVIDLEKSNRYNEAYLVKYHSSWDWQVPAWSKIADFMHTMVIRKYKKNRQIPIEYDSLFEHYSIAIQNNDLSKGFETIINAIKWFNQQNI